MRAREVCEGHAIDLSIYRRMCRARFDICDAARSIIFNKEEKKLDSAQPLQFRGPPTRHCHTPGVPHRTVSLALHSLSRHRGLCAHTVRQSCAAERPQRYLYSVLEEPYPLAPKLGLHT